jgi:hypothetical protein
MECSPGRNGSIPNLLTLIIFDFWFKDITGKDIDNEGPDSSQYWIIQLMLEYEP